MVKIFDLYHEDENRPFSGYQGACFISLSDMASSPDQHLGPIAFLPFNDFLSIFVYEENEMDQSDVYKTRDLLTGCFRIETEFTVCDWLEFFVFVLENKNNNQVVVFNGIYNSEDMCCIYMGEGILLVNPDTKVIENYEENNKLFNRVDSLKSSSGMIFDNIQVFNPGLGAAFDRTEKFQEDLLARSKNVALIEYDVWENQTRKIIQDYQRLLNFYKEKILMKSTGREFEAHSKLIRKFIEKVNDFNSRLNR